MRDPHQMIYNNSDLLDRTLAFKKDTEVVWSSDCHFSYCQFYNVYMYPDVLKEFIDEVKVIFGDNSFNSLRSYATKNDHGVFRICKLSNEEKFEKLLVEFTKKHSLTLSPLFYFTSGGINLL